MVVSKRHIVAEYMLTGEKWKEKFGDTICRTIIRWTSGKI